MRALVHIKAEISDWFVADVEAAMDTVASAIEEPARGLIRLDQEETMRDVQAIASGLRELGRRIKEQNSA